MKKIDYPKLKAKFYRLSYTEAMLVARDLSGGLTPQYFTYMKEYEKHRQKSLEKQMVFNEQVGPRSSDRSPRKSARVRGESPHNSAQQRLAL